MLIYGAMKTRNKLLDIIKSNNLNNTGIEVGVQEGVFSKKILSNWPGKLYMVDAWRHFDNYIDTANVSDEVHTMRLLTALENTQSFKNRRCVICELSLDAAKMFPDNYFDWIYLDAAHDKESVLKDLEAWFPKLKSGGIMCGDDYLQGHHFDTEFGVIAALEEYRGSDVNVISGDSEIPQWWFKK